MNGCTLNSGWFLVLALGTDGEMNLTRRALNAISSPRSGGCEPQPIGMRLRATSSMRGAMRIAYYPSDFTGHELRYSCTKCRRSGSMQADALAHYGNKALSDLRYDCARLAAIGLSP
jgi:hypothetical protein